MATEDDRAFEAMALMARADLDRVAGDLAEQRQATVEQPMSGVPLAVSVAALDARLWAEIESRGNAHE